VAQLVRTCLCETVNGALRKYWVALGGPVAHDDRVRLS
jgi:hypothetical protein